jgi:PadR family transcriptional regulator PadR
MRRGRGCHRGGPPHSGPCTCEMGNLYRFAEPIVLLTVARLGQAHGYQISRDAEELAVTHSGIDSAAVYRTLRRLEEAGMVVSSWDIDDVGPPRRVYRVTPAGYAHLSEWGLVLAELADAIKRLSQMCIEESQKMTPSKSQQ